MKQHITDPARCIQCSACEMACPNHAIESIAGRFCIDSAQCNECGACIRECPTGAADTYIEVRQLMTVEEQAAMMELPVASG